MIFVLVDIFQSRALLFEILDGLVVEHVLQVEAEVVLAVFAQVREVESQPHQIRLGAVIEIIWIIIQDEVFADFARWNLQRYVLEQSPVVRISKHVITMNTLNEPTVSFESSCVFEFFFFGLVDE